MHQTGEGDELVHVEGQETVDLSNGSAVTTSRHDYGETEKAIHAFARILADLAVRRARA